MPSFISSFRGYNKNDFSVSGIRTRIVGVEDTYANLLTTTTAPYFHCLILKF